MALRRVGGEVHCGEWGWVGVGQFYLLSCFVERKIK